MIGLDTNVLVRFITQDNPIQSRQARELIERRLTVENPGYISILAMAETAWVLERAYSLSIAQLAATIERILQIDVLVVECEQEVFAAMTALEAGEGAFADSLIASLGGKAGCSSTVTFDKKALRLPGYTSVRTELGE